MKLIDVINETNAVKIDEVLVKNVEEKYSCNLPEKVKHILSIPVNEESYDEQPLLRKLSNDMILEADKEMHIHFCNQKMLPVFDSGDNDYICYNYVKHVWCMFNIADEIVFNEHEQLSELFS